LGDYNEANQANIQRTQEFKIIVLGVIENKDIQSESHRYVRQQKHKHRSKSMHISKLLYFGCVPFHKSFDEGRGYAAYRDKS